MPRTHASEKRNKNSVMLFTHPLNEITQEAFAKLGIDKTIQILLPLVYGAGEWKNGGVTHVEGCNSDNQGGSGTYANCGYHEPIIIL